MKLRRSFKFRLFLGLYATIFLIIVLFSTAIFAWLRARSVEDIERAQLSALHNIDRMFTASLDGFARNAAEIYSDSNTLALLARPEKNWLSFAIRYTNRARIILANSQAIGLVGLFDKQEILMLNQRITISEESRTQLHTLLTGESGSIVLLPARYMVTGSEVPMLCLVAGQYNTPGHSWEEGVIVGVNASELTGNILGSDENLYVVDRQGRVILSNHPDLFGQPLSEEGYLERILSASPEETFNWEIAGKEHTLGVVGGANGQYRVVSIQPTDTLFTSLRSGYWQFLLMGGAGLALSFALALLVSLKLSKPVNLLVDDLATFSHAAAPDSSIGDVDFARAALKQTTRMISDLKEAHLQSQRIQWLTGLRPDLSEQMLFPGADTLCAAVFQLESGKETLPMELSLLADTIKTILLDNLHWEGSIVLPLREDRLTLLLPQEQGQAVSVLRKLQASLTSLLSASVDVAVAECSEGTSLRERHDIVLKRLRAAALRGAGCFLTNQSEAAMGREPFSSDLSELTSTAVRSADRLRIAVAVDKLLLEAAGLEYSYAIEQLCVLGVEATEAIGAALPESKETRWADMYRVLSACETRRQLSSELVKLLDSISVGILTASNIGVADNLQLAMDLIEESYCDPELSLQNVAKRVGMSASYFSKIFRERTGKTFPVYVNGLRMRRACQLLQEDGDKTAAQIAREVGFNSSSYFTASFRKQYGVSPIQARQYNILHSLLAEIREVDR